MSQFPRLVAIFVCIGLSGCATSNVAKVVPAHDAMDATVWIQTSTEYAAATTSIYAAATAMLDRVDAAKLPKRPAVVLDVDETVLDNSPYQGQLIQDGTRYESESWDRWIALRSATAVPGVVDFLAAAQARDVQVVLVTNRRCRAREGTASHCPQHEDTLANLRTVGIDTAATLLFLRDDEPVGPCAELLTADEIADGKWSSDKTSRRACVSLDHTIVMLFGDQLGDFIEESSGASGRDVAASHSAQWGRAWFMLPNPTYGSWLPRDYVEKQQLIRGIE
ncbi:MAG: HAD family acid phosphatase [Pseudomonadota bacterium]